MNRIFIVDSYSNDEPQHFSDIVVAQDEEDAKNQVYAARPYLMEWSAEAQTIHEEIRCLEKSLKHLKSLTIKQARKDWESMLDEEGYIP